MTRRVSTVGEIDEVAQQFRRLPDRPDSRILRPRRPGNEKLAKAKQRLRTATWRTNNDRRGRPTSDVLARALLLTVCTSPNFQKLLGDDLSIVRQTCNALVEKGFKLDEIQDVMRKVRLRNLDPADRACDPTETPSSPIVASE